MILLLSVLAFQRTITYKDEFSLWTDTVRESQSKARPHNNFGRAYEEMEMPDYALREYLEAIRLNPGFAPSHSNAASIYVKQGRLDDAEIALKLAIAGYRYRHFEDLHRRLGFVYIKKGLINDAIKEFEKAKALIANHPDARRAVAALYTNEAWQYTDKGDFSGAVLLHGTAVSIDPSYADAHYGLALDYEALGQKEDAIKHWQEYLKLAPQGEPFRKDAMKHLERLRK
ncbi:MAG: tetratricopeptide repeat protein [Deltaproteobacteria bacterium]|nr:tetratricopeptide repeat protein [Deltaproteobacteria bacterium]